MIEFDDYPTELIIPDYQNKPYIVCDGGSSYWGVLYDPGTKKFLELAFNGVG